MMQNHRRIFPRDDIEGFIDHLARKYPACFFTDARLKRPLKKNILNDLEKEGVLDEDKLQAAFTFYTQDWNYENQLQAGCERVDLDGKKAGVVTEQEQREAKQRVLARKQEYRERNPILVARSLHTDQLSKIPAPMRMKQECDPLLGRLQALFMNTDAVLQKTEDQMLRTALLAASLRVLITEAENVIKHAEELK